MQFIQISQYNYETMQLAQPIFDRMRRILLTAGRTIHPTILKRLENMGISTLMVEDAESKGITIDEMLDMPTWMDTIEVIQKAYDLSKNNQPLNIIEIQRATTKIIQEVSHRKTICLVPSTAVTEDLRVFAHSVNVTLLVVQTSKELNYSQSKVRDLAIGTLLHDIGKALTNDPMQHPTTGFEIIKKNRELSLLSAHIAYQHHETMNGKGYPRGLSGEEILEFPQICAIANLYENLISNDGYLPHEALEIIMTKSETEYPIKIIKAFMNSIPSYIPGTKVLLSNNQKAIVIGIKSHLHRPVVRCLDTQEEIDLAKQPSLMINEILK